MGFLKQPSKITSKPYICREKISLKNSIINKINLKQNPN